MDAGKYRYRVAFDAPTQTQDGSGGTEAGWTAVGTGSFLCWADFRYLRGGETVQAARLSGRQPAVVTIRRNSVSAAVTPAWRMRDLRSGVIYNVRSIVPTDDRARLELLCESGVAV